MRMIKVRTYRTINRFIAIAVFLITVLEIYILGVSFIMTNTENEGLIDVGKDFLIENRIIDDKHEALLDDYWGDSEYYKFASNIWNSQKVFKNILSKLNKLNILQKEIYPSYLELKIWSWVGLIGTYAVIIIFLFAGIVLLYILWEIPSLFKKIENSSDDSINYNDFIFYCYLLLAVVYFSVIAARLAVAMPMNMINEYQSSQKNIVVKYIFTNGIHPVILLITLYILNTLIDKILKKRIIHHTDPSIKNKVSNKSQVPPFQTVENPLIYQATQAQFHQPVQSSVCQQVNQSFCQSTVNFCPNCGTSINAEEKFCKHCGKPIMSTNVKSLIEQDSSPSIPHSVKPAPIFEDKLEFDVKLTEVNEENRLKVIDIVKNVTGLSLTEAKQLVISVPTLLKTGVSKKEAEYIKQSVEAKGGTVVLIPLTIDENT